MFGAFFDDSGTHPASRVCLFAGYVAPQEEWERFAVEWRALLRDANVPYFRAYDCVRGDGVFAGVSEAEREGYYTRAVDIIVARSLVAIAVGGRRHDFEGENLDWPAANAYEYSVRYGLLTLALVIGEKWLGDRIPVICEEGKVADVRTVMEMYLDLVEHEKYGEMLRHTLAGPPSFHAKEDHLELQAADVFAYEMGRHMAQSFHNPKGEKQRVEGIMLQLHAAAHGGTVLLPYKKPKE